MHARNRARVLSRFRKREMERERQGRETERPPTKMDSEEGWVERMGREFAQGVSAAMGRAETRTPGVDRERETEGEGEYPWVEAMGREFASYINRAPEVEGEREREMGGNWVEKLGREFAQGLAEVLGVDKGTEKKREREGEGEAEGVTWMERMGREFAESVGTAIEQARERVEEEGEELEEMD
ncbi:hypothetical protein KIPB_001189 [Kipferlia bialata]|uniref:Uncharacterized protein n=1 Tax=Kipferlia bialata TaxID=797122 RepID=A0A391NRY3_9EUKA|nr:hypothetical protein KIPB_001189 [Kipferlia bialata]|eukprot:g1189.t1